MLQQLLKNNMRFNNARVVSTQFNASSRKLEKSYGIGCSAIHLESKILSAFGNICIMQGTFYFLDDSYGARLLTEGFRDVEWFLSVWSLLKLLIML